jgi:membrane-associated protease RseP (regulator of RpoE activity)
VNVVSPAMQVDMVGLLRSAASQFMHINDTTVGEGQDYAARFRGRLTMESTAAYRLAAESFRPLGYTPLFRKEGDTHVVLAVAGVVERQPSNPRTNVVLFVLTVASVLFTGAIYGASSLLPASLGDWPGFLLGGVPFLFCMLGTLLAHELGHYFAARYHKVEVTLPYFLPLPLISPFGTLGAVIRLKAPPTNRRVLLDIGIAGPLAGLVIALPVVIYGLATSPVEPLPALLPGQALQIEGNSILYASLKRLILGQWLPAPATFGGVPPLLYMLRFYVTGQPAPIGGTDVLLNSIAWAGWGGLLVTGLNLIPAGQLDGGHALYVLIGRQARRVVPFVIVVLVVLGLFWPGWFLYAAIIYFMGRMHAEPLDQITEVDPLRRALAILVLVIFVLIFTPVPIMIIGPA